jgi:GNAT superfamily N-acetyltransferase
MSVPDGFAIRSAAAGDIETLVAHRRAMFVDMGYRDEAVLDRMAGQCHMIGSGPRGNIVNVYTEAAFRRRGLAGELMKVALEWCRENGVDLVVLHASEDGRRLYEAMGFAASNEMRIRL